jgi:dihydroxyacetone kinase-like predicted kinase
VAVVAVAVGEGLAAALRSMGATAIVGGGQTMNPSTEELLAAVEAVAAPAAILLPNNPNIVLTASQVPGLATKPVGVVPSRSVPQGLAALVAFNGEDGLEANLGRMTPALAGVRTVEVTRAVREATIEGVRAAAGQVIGLVDDRLVTAGEDPIAVAAAALAAADLAGAELVTVFLGDEATPDQGTALRNRLLADHPELTVEVHDGGQPHYLFVIAVD